MDVFKDYLSSIDSPDHRLRMEEILSWTAEQFPGLTPQIKWNTPMFTDQGTFIIGFAAAKHHVSVSPEEAGIAHFADDIARAGYSATSRLFRIQWTEPVHYELLESMIQFNIQDKADCSAFWRK
ncbi:iron chaperone [Bacillus amyloliquefaciens]|uniref:iron chaperone n=1 Tax=Bacillus amyloliquefaciens group TaxID=1938374 RepID=UPI002948148B|nr:iron chaperone [Bacillus velezensis]MDV5127418.1 iron chaperone [Bacillus velezensis]